MKVRLLVLAVVALTCGWTTTALADLPNQDLVCSPDEPVMEDSETLRAWSLQLRGYPPTINEYDAVETGVVSS